MALPATIKVIQTDLFTPEDELRKDYDDITVARILRIRELYSYFVANPHLKDRELIDHALTFHKISQSAAYTDLSVIKTLLPTLSRQTRDFHRWRANEMLLETYRLAKARKDTKTMERAASSYAKYNRVDMEDEQHIPYDEIVVQPFTATNNPEVLGIKPIPNIQQRIKDMIAHYTKESRDIEDVQYEEVDLEENELFGDGEGEPEK